MPKSWISLILLIFIFTVQNGRKGLAQTKPEASWQGSWVAMRDQKSSRPELLFSPSRETSNNSDINAIIAQVIDSRRQGRNLEQYDQIYADGNIDEALQGGNEVEARNIIRDKLCYLGLMSCEVTEKRPQFIIPNGGGGGGGGGGRPQPMRYLSNYNIGTKPLSQPPMQSYNTFGPPRKVGYIQSSFNPNNYIRPMEHGPSLGNAFIYSPRPISTSLHNPPYALQQSHLEKYPVTPNIYGQQTTASSNIVVGQVASVSSSTSNAGLQQHVHHHFHHVDGTNEKVSDSASASASLPINSGVFSQHQQTQNLASIGGIQASVIGGGAGLGGFNIAGSHTARPSLSNGYIQAGPGQHSQIGGSFHTQNPGFYKKELQNLGGITIASNGFNNAQQQNFGGGVGLGGFERKQILNCFCVPYHQCSAADRLGRKEDLILPVDPRNIGKDIEALQNEDFSNGTRVARGEKRHAKRTTGENNSETESSGQSEQSSLSIDSEGRAYYGNRRQENSCRINEVCCRRPLHTAAIPQHHHLQQQQPHQQQQQFGQCGTRNAAGITGRIKNPVYVDGDSEFGEYPWHVAILKKDPRESIYACGATLIDTLHVITAAHCIKAQNGFELRARLGEWDVNHDVEFFPYVEREIIAIHIHPEYYAGTLDNDLALLRFDQPIDFQRNPHISPACLPDKYADYTGARCWTTGWGKNAFGDHGKYQNILKEVDVPILSHQQCEIQLRHTRLGYNYKLNPGFLCAGGEEGKDACKGDGGGPLVCERNGIWNVIGVVSWGIGCGQPNIPGVYIRVAHYIDWIRQLTQHH